MLVDVVIISMDYDHTYMLYSQSIAGLLLPVTGQQRLSLTFNLNVAVNEASLSVSMFSHQSTSFSSSISREDASEQSDQFSESTT